MEGDSLYISSLPSLPVPASFCIAPVLTLVLKSQAALELFLRELKVNHVHASFLGVSHCSTDQELCISSTGDQVSRKSGE